MKAQQEAELAELEAAKQTKRIESQLAQMRMREHLDQQVWLGRSVCFIWPSNSRMCCQLGNGQITCQLCITHLYSKVQAVYVTVRLELL